MEAYDLMRPVLIPKAGDTCKVACNIGCSVHNFFDSLLVSQVTGRSRLHCQARDCVLQGFSLRKIVKYATNKGFTGIVVFNEDRKKVNGMLLIHLPDGPTANFRLSNLSLSSDIMVSMQSLLHGLRCRQ